MYRCKHFIIQELVPRYIYEKWGDKAWMFVDEQMAVSIDQLRDQLGRITINDWHTGGTNEWRGLRTPLCPEYSELSEHTHFKAADCITLDRSIEDARKFVLSNPKLFPFITGVELDVNWLHVDCRNTEQFYTFKK